MSGAAHPVVGVIGGMGPEATIDLLRRIVARTPAADDADHIHVIVESNPKIPSRIAHLIEGTGEDPTPELVRVARNLQAAGATLLAMPCNTAHGYSAAIRAAVSIPLLDMVALASRRVAEATAGRRVGLLASTAVHLTGLYAGAFSGLGMTVAMPAHQADVMGLIRAVKRGDTGPAARARLAELCAELATRADVILIACTELSVLGSGLQAGIPVVDAMDALTEGIIDAVSPIKR